jgi:hypothetical protein
MVRDILTAVHAAAGTLAFAAGVVLIAAVLRGRQPDRMAVGYADALAVLAATTAALVGWDWPGLGTGARAGFAALVVLAAVMAGAAGRAWSLARRQPPAWRRRFVAAVGFTLIALFDGFAIITALDAKAPGWAVAVVAVAAVLVGRRVVRRAERRAGPVRRSPAG